MFGFREIKVQDAKKILDWRTSKTVSRFMKSELSYDLQKQENWISQSYHKSDYYHWVVTYNGTDVGFLNFSSWNRSHECTSWGFYLAETEASGLGAFIPPYFYNFAFNYLQVKKIFAEVFQENTKAIKMHLAQGYTFEQDKNYSFNKNGAEILLVHMALQKENFQSTKFAKFKNTMPLKHWAGNPFRDNTDGH